MTDDEAIAEIRSMLEEACRTTAGMSNPVVMNRETTRPLRTVSFEFKGWSPSLHDIKVQGLAATMATGALVDMKAKVALAIGIQRRRSLHAAKLKRKLPYATSSNMAVDHLRVDSGLLRIAQGNGTALRPTLRSMMGDLHNFTRYVGSDRLENDKVAVVDVDANEGPVSIALPRLRISPETTFDGESIHIAHAGLPETALTALVGRCVGDVASVHPDVDGRTIIHASNVSSVASSMSRGPQIELIVAVHPVPLPPSNGTSAGLAPWWIRCRTGP